MLVTRNRSKSEGLFCEICFDEFFEEVFRLLYGERVVFELDRVLFEEDSSNFDL